MTFERPRAILFDYGNVLVGPLDRDAFTASQDTMALDYGFENGQALWNHIYISEAWEQAKHGRITYEALWIDRLSVLGIHTDASRTAFKRRLFSHWAVFPQMRKILANLQDRGYQLGVLSNSARQEFRRYLEQRRGFVNLFDVVISSADVGYAKPEEEIYRFALEQLALPPEAALFIDDLPRNTLAAEQIGIATIVFTTPPDLVEELNRRSIL